MNQLDSDNKAVVDITLCLRCALPSPLSQPIGRIVCTQNFPDSYLRLPGILNHPFCCITLLAIEWSLLQWTHYSAFSVGRKNPKVTPSPWDFVTLPEKGRATAIGNMHKNLVKIAHLASEICSQTDRQTDTQTDVLITVLHHCSRRRSNDSDNGNKNL